MDSKISFLTIQTSFAGNGNGVAQSEALARWTPGEQPQEAP